MLAVPVAENAVRRAVKQMDRSEPCSLLSLALIVALQIYLISERATKPVSLETEKKVRPGVCL